MVATAQLVLRQGISLADMLFTEKTKTDHMKLGKRNGLLSFDDK